MPTRIHMDACRPKSHLHASVWTHVGLPHTRIITHHPCTLTPAGPPTHSSKAAGRPSRNDDETVSEDMDDNDYTRCVLPFSSIGHLMRIQKHMIIAEPSSSIRRLHSLWRCGKPLVYVRRLSMFPNCIVTEETDNHDYSWDIPEYSIIEPSLKMRETMIICETSLDAGKHDHM